MQALVVLTDLVSICGLLIVGYVAGYLWKNWW